MKIVFPSREFDDAVAAVCDGLVSDEQGRALNELLRNDTAARDEYILRVEVHSRLASEPDLFASENAHFSDRKAADRIIPFPVTHGNRRKGWIWKLALAASLVLIAAGIWNFRQSAPSDRSVTTSKAVAMLDRTADAQWKQGDVIPKLGAPLDPVRLRLQAGLAQITFYSGARVVIEGPAELELISRNEAFCRAGRLVAEAPPQARGFRIATPHALLTDLGSSFGVDVHGDRTELHVLKGNVKLGIGGKAAGEVFQEGAGVIVDSSDALGRIEARPEAFASLFDLQARSVAAEAQRLDQWRTACKRLTKDGSLIVHFDFENVASSGWQLRNFGNGRVSDGAIVGCQWTEGRWPEKRALEFQSVSDRVRLTVPGEFQALTLSAWVCVKGLDRKINSLFMSDGFEPGTIHWVIRRDGVLGVTVIGASSDNFQLVTSPPVVTLEKLGMWMHLAVVLDGSGKRAVHYVNGVPVSDQALKIPPPYRVGPAELGNWNAKGFPEKDPFMIRNFSGATDDFCLFGRALSAGEIRALFLQGKPQPEPIAKQALVNKP